MFIVQLLSYEALSSWLPNVDLWSFSSTFFGVAFLLFLTLSTLHLSNLQTFFRSRPVFLSALTPFCPYKGTCLDVCATLSEFFQGGVCSSGG